MQLPGARCVPERFLWCCSHHAVLSADRILEAVREGIDAALFDTTSDGSSTVEVLPQRLPPHSIQQARWQDTAVRVTLSAAGLAMLQKRIDVSAVVSSWGVVSGCELMLLAGGCG